MGGVCLALRSPNFINFNNPASYTAFDTISFVFSGALVSNYSGLKTSSLSQKYNYVSLGHLLFGFPISKWWAASFGLLPYSNVGYKIYDSGFLENIGQAEYMYEGAGGINQFYIGNAWKLSKNLSIGVNSSYLFGTINKIQTVAFPDSLYILNSRQKNYTTINDFFFNFGIQYSHKLHKDLYLGAGIEFNSNTDINAKQKIIAERFDSSGYYELIKDSVLNTDYTKGSIILPQSIGAGIILKKQDKWLIGVDYQWQDWSGYSCFGKTDSLKNSYQISAGAEITPNNINASSYWKKMKYRFGFRYDKTYLQLKNTQIDEFGISFGLGLPLKKTRTSINVSMEIGQRGTTDNSLIQENFGRLTVGFNIQERWFVKRKFY